ncbi:MAG: DUF1028 domain-containing protein [Candidatus Nanoarchaeia archaeon]
MTFTIIGIDKKSKEIGVATFSKVVSVGAMVPAVDLESGVVATQAVLNVSYKENGLDLMKKHSPEKVINILTSKDKEKEVRQIILMNKKGETAVFTGDKATSWKGYAVGENCVCAGNTLVGEQVVQEAISSFENSKKPLAEKLIDALEAGNKVGGDKRKTKYNSAALIIDKKNKGVFGIGNKYLDLRVDYSRDSIKDLQKLYVEKISELRRWNKWKKQN